MGRRLSYLPVAFLLWILLSTPLNSSFVGKLLFRCSSWLKGALIYHGLKAFLLKRENSIMTSQLHARPLVHPQTPVLRRHGCPIWIFGRKLSAPRAYPRSWPPHRSQQPVPKELLVAIMTVVYISRHASITQSFPMLQRQSSSRPTLTISSAVDFAPFSIHKQCSFTGRFNVPTRGVTRSGQF